MEHYDIPEEIHVAYLIEEEMEDPTSERFNFTLGNFWRLQVISRYLLLKPWKFKLMSWESATTFKPFIQAGTSTQKNAFGI